MSALDTSNNESAPSDQVSARARNSSYPVPTLQSVQYAVLDNGTTCNFNNGCTDPNSCDIGEENDDTIQVSLSWSAPSGAYRIYRKAATEDHFHGIADVSAPGGSTTYNDTSVTGSDYTYFIASLHSTTTFDEGGGSAALEAQDSYPSGTAVRNVTVRDGHDVFSTDNRESRIASVQWSRVTETALQGYNVYRRCDYWGCQGGFQASADHFKCEPNWMLMTTTPLGPEFRYFDDTSVAGLQGCYYYAVRPIGPGGVEGPITKATFGYLQSGQADNTSLHCRSVTMIPEVCAHPSQNAPSCWTPIATELDGINGQAPGTGDPSGAPPSPTSVTRTVITKDGRTWGGGQARTQVATVSWSMPSPIPSDLLGFYVEEAGSPAGPWQRSEHLVAWWERNYSWQGIGVEDSIANPPFGGHSECASFRVIAVDRQGNESAPVVATTPDSNSCPVTAAAPTNLTATNLHDPGGLLSDCQIKLTWTQSAGATGYYIYRLIDNGNFPYFYDTKYISADPTSNTMTWNEPGDWASSSNRDTNCPAFSPTQYCKIGALDVYYVTARGASGGESPRSNLVYWKCNLDPGYDAKLDKKPARDGTWPGAEAPVEPLMCANPQVEQSKAEEAANWTPVRGGGEFVPDGAIYSVKGPSRGTYTGSNTFVASAVEPVVRDSGDGARSRSSRDVAKVRSGALATSAMLRLGSLADPPWLYIDLHTDHLGTVRAETDANGGTAGRHDYFPFGEEIYPVASYNSHQYTGHERDRESGLDYMMARYLETGLSRFLSVDPTSASALRANPQSWNRYSYVLGNPMRLVDPRGQEAKATVDDKSKTITVTIEIDIYGPDASDEVAANIENGIEGEWNGHTYTDPQTGTEYTVKVDAQVRNVGEDKKNATADNQIKVDKSVERDFVKTAGKVDTGKWNPGSGGKTFAHEAGHLMGLRDDYKDRKTPSGTTSVPRPGHEGHLMAEPGGRVAPHEIRDAVAPAVRQHDRQDQTTTTHRLHEP